VRSVFVAVSSPQQRTQLRTSALNLAKNLRNAYVNTVQQYEIVLEMTERFDNYVEQHEATCKARDRSQGIVVDPDKAIAEFTGMD